MTEVMRGLPSEVQGQQIKIGEEMGGLPARTLSAMEG
jgi:hypothetical protein